MPIDSHNQVFVQSFLPPKLAGKLCSYVLGIHLRCLYNLLLGLWFNLLLLLCYWLGGGRTFVARVIECCKKVLGLRERHVSHCDKRGMSYRGEAR